MAGIFLTQGKGGLAEGQHFVWDTSRLVSPIPASAQSQTASGSGCETTDVDRMRKSSPPQLTSVTLHYTPNGMSLSRPL